MPFSAVFALRNGRAKSDVPRIAVLVDTSTGWGRRLIRGIVGYVHKHRPSNLWVRACYGAYPVLWILAGELHNDSKWGVGPWGEVGRYVRSMDPYERPITTHTGGGRRGHPDDELIVSYDVEEYPWWRFEPHPEWAEEGSFAAGIPGENGGRATDR